VGIIHLKEGSNEMAEMGKKMEALRTSNYICNQNIKGQKVLGDEDGGKEAHWSSFSKP